MARHRRAGRQRGRGRGRGARGGVEARDGNRGAPGGHRAGRPPRGAPGRGGLQRAQEFDLVPNARNNNYNLRRLPVVPRPDSPNSSIPEIDVLMPANQDFNRGRGMVRGLNRGRGDAAQGRGRYQPPPREHDAVGEGFVFDDVEPLNLNQGEEFDNRDLQNEPALDNVDAQPVLLDEVNLRKRKAELDIEENQAKLRIIEAEKRQIELRLATATTTRTVFNEVPPSLINNDLSATIFRAVIQPFNFSNPTTSSASSDNKHALLNRRA